MAKIKVNIQLATLLAQAESQLATAEKRLAEVEADKSKLIALVHEHRDCIRMVISDIRDEIDSRPEHASVGKKGCHGRLIGLILSTPSVAKALTPPTEE